MFRPAPRKALRAAGRVLAQVAFGAVLFAVLIVALTWSVHGLILLIQAIP